MLFKPFGPEIYKTTLTEETRAKLEQIILENVDKKEKQYNSRLVGFIKKEVDILDEIKNDVLKELQNIVIEYLNTSTGLNDSFKPIKQRDIHCVASWGNIQESNEFNPMHHHPNCDIVCVTFPKVKINNNNPYTTNSNLKSGSLILTYGEGSNFFENSFHVIEPITADVYVFPSFLKHGTIPVFKDDIRISTSTNFCFSEYFRMKVNPPKSK